jgi:hypothetical protein
VNGDNVVAIIFLVSLFSFLAIASWVDARRKEREAFYRSEAIKRLSEMQGAVPDAVLQLLREALTTSPEIKSPSPTWNPGEYRRARKAQFQNEMLNKLAAMPGATAESAMEFLRNEQRIADRRWREGMQLAGMITTAAGIGLLIFLRPIVPDMPVYLVGFIPVLVGIALMIAAKLRSES